jgi:hypothetical protein
MSVRLVVDLTVRRSRFACKPGPSAPTLRAGVKRLGAMLGRHARQAENPGTVRRRMIACLVVCLVVCLGSRDHSSLSTWSRREARKSSSVSGSSSPIIRSWRVTADLGSRSVTRG